MTCKSCGKELAPDTKICDACGAPVEEATTPKKSKKGLFIALGIVVILAAIVVAVAFPFVKNTLSKTFLPTEKYYQSVEKSAIEKSIDSLAEQVDEIKRNADIKGGFFDYCDSVKVDSTLSLTIGDSIIKALSDNSGADLSFLKTVGVGTDLAVKDGRLGLILSLMLDGNHLLTADAILDSGDYTAYLSLPQLTEDAISLDLEELTGVSADEIAKAFDESLENGVKIYGALPQGSVLKRVAMRYVDLILSELDDVEKKTHKISIYDIEADCTALTVTVSEKNLKSIISSLLEEFRDDDELWSIIEELVKVTDPSVLVERMSARDELKESFEEIKDGLIQSVDGFGELEYTVYVNARGEVIGRDIAIGETVIELYSIIDGRNVGFELNVEGEELSYLDIKADGTLKDGLFNGEATLKIAEQSMAKLIIENADLEGEDIKGKITLNPSKVVTEVIGMLASDLENDKGINLDALGISLEDPSAVLEFKASEKETGLYLSILSKDNLLIGLGTHALAGEATAVEAPSDTMKVETQEDIQRWASTFDVMGFIETLPESISGIVYLILLSVMG